MKSIVLATGGAGVGRVEERRADDPARAQKEEFHTHHDIDGKSQKMEAGPRTVVRPGDVIIMPERFS